MDVLNFFDELKPFGKGFEAETKFTFLLDRLLFKNITTTRISGNI